MQVSTLGIIPPEIVPSAINSRASSGESCLISLLRFVQHAGHVGEQEEPLGLERTGDRAGERVGIDVIGAALCRGRERG
jgi:hypothetical protein